MYEFERPLKETHPMSWKVYQEEIKKPMDIKTIKEKRDKKLYKSFGSIDADITIMYQNCINYNVNQSIKPNLKPHLENDKKLIDVLSDIEDQLLPLFHESSESGEKLTFF